MDNEVIEQAAKVGAEAIYWTLEWEQLDDATRSDAIEFARALHAAGLLADPAGRDEEAIGRVVEIIARMSWEGPEQEWPLWRDATEDDRQRIREKVQPIAETLADEGLLTNPDEFVSSWAAGKERARAERAEAERDHFRERYADAHALWLRSEDARRSAEAEVERQYKVICRLERTVEGYEKYPVDGAEVIAKENAELRATVARVRELADRLDSPYSNPSVRYMSTRIREALDGEGEQ